MSRYKQTYELTEVIVNVFFTIVDKICSMPNVDIADVYMAFKAFERLCIQGLHTRMCRQHPYDHIAKTSRSTDASPSKIDRIVNKK